MRSSRSTALTVLVCILALLLGGMTIVAVRFYYAYTLVEVEKIRAHSPVTASRIVLIEAVDPTTNTISARTLDRDLYGSDKVSFVVTTATKIELQKPIVEKGIVVGFSEFKSEEIVLSPGAEISVTLATDDSGRYYALSITVGVPFLSDTTPTPSTASSSPNQ